MAATGSASDTRTGTTSTSASVSRKCRLPIQSKNMLFVCEESSKNIGAVKKAAMIILSESMESPEKDSSLCKMQTFAKCYPPDNPASKDLAPPELNPDASWLTQDAVIPLLECKHFSPTSNIRRIFNFRCQIFRLLWWVCWTWWGYLFFKCKQISQLKLSRNCRYFARGNFAIIRIMLRANI